MVKHTMRLHDTLLLGLAIALLTGCAGGLTGSLPLTWTPTHQLHQDFRNEVPGARETLQATILAQDLTTALRLLQPDTLYLTPQSPAPSLEDIFAAGMLVDWPQTPEGQAYGWEPLAAGAIAHPGTIGYTLLDPPTQAGYYGPARQDCVLTIGVSDPAITTAPTATARLSQTHFYSTPFNRGGNLDEQVNSLPGDPEDEFRSLVIYAAGQVHRVTTPEARRYLALSQAIKYRLDLYMDIYGQLPPTYADLLAAFHLAPLTYTTRTTDPGAQVPTPAEPGWIFRGEIARHQLAPDSWQYLMRLTRKPPGFETEESLIFRYAVDYRQQRIRTKQVLTPALLPRAKSLVFLPWMNVWAAEWVDLRPIQQFQSTPIGGTEGSD